jgi:chaperonin GroES
MKIRPLKDRVLVEPIEVKEMEKGGIIIPDSAKEAAQEGTVVAVGKGKTDDSGKLVPMDVKKGDVVLLPKYGGTDVKINDKEYKIVSEDDIVAIVG